MACVCCSLCARSACRGRLRPALDHDARDPGGDERDEGHSEHHLDATDHPPGVGLRHDIAIPDRRDGLQRPPDRRGRAREVLLIQDPHHDGACGRQDHEGHGETERHGAGIGDPLHTAVDRDRGSSSSRRILRRSCISCSTLHLTVPRGRPARSRRAWQRRSSRLLRAERDSPGLPYSRHAPQPRRADGQGSGEVGRVLRRAFRSQRAHLRGRRTADPRRRPMGRSLRSRMPNPSAGRASPHEPLRVPAGRRRGRAGCTRAVPQPPASPSSSGRTMDDSCASRSPIPTATASRSTRTELRQEPWGRRTRATDPEARHLVEAPKLRSTKRPRPGSTWSAPSSTSTSPRLMVTTG